MRKIKSKNEKHSFIITIMKQRLLYSLLLLFVCLTSSVKVRALEQDANGVYQIGTAQDLMDFAAVVNDGTTAANAVLTADIDLSTVLTEETLWIPIGNGDKLFKGTFDGQGHAITNFNYVATAKYNGLFGYIEGAIIKNFSISGTLTSTFAQNGVIGQADGAALVSGIHSALDINVKDCSSHTGGVVGGSGGSSGCTLMVENCEYSGTLTHSGTGDCQAGILGYTYAGGVRNCIFRGTINGEAKTKYGGILAYCKVPGFLGVKNCLSIGKINAPAPQQAAAIIANWNGDVTSNVKNNYFCLQEGSTTSIGVGNKTASCEPPVVVTPEELASGEICYKLNGENTDDIAYYQTLGEDDVPTLDTTHKQVYAVGERLCDGSFSGDIVYSNDNSGAGIIPDHEFEDGYCSVCGALDLSYMSPVDGWYEIATARQLRWFADFVNVGNYDINAKLVDDLNLSYEEEISVIGNSPSNAYKGIFDGQGHELNSYFLTVSDFTAGYGYGLFGNTNGATIKDFNINGEITFENGGAAPSADLGCGLIGWPDGGTLIQNIKNNVDIYANISTHVGGMVGSLRTATVDRCEFAGRLNGLSSKNGVAGIAGYTNTGTITNCIFSGKIEGDGTGYYAGILGYVNNASALVKGCLSVGTVENEVSSYVGGVLGRVRNIGPNYANNFYTGEIKGIGGGDIADKDFVVANTTLVSDEQVRNGDVTWGLNGSTYVVPVFYQTLGQDDVPVWDSTHELVYPTVDGFGSMLLDDPMDDFLDKFAELEQDNAEKTVACQQVIDDYLAAIAPLDQTSSYEEFVNAYAEVKPLLDSVQVSVGYYKAYSETCSSVSDYMEKNDVGGKEFDVLNTYLTTDAEPSEEFPNGTYLYIIRTHLLTNAQIEAEAKDVDARLQAAIANNYIENTDITSMLVNPNFVDGVAGWETQAKPSVATVGSYTAAEVTNTFAITQTLTDLKNGIYLFAANAQQRAGGDLTSQYYAAQLVANDNMNYIQVPGEDYVEEKAATDDKEYKIGEEVLGYVPATANGFTYAMAVDRYQNYTAVRVTDGQLTVGITNPGTGLGTDQVLMGGLRLIYLGKGDTPCEGMDVVLESYSKRAKTIIDFLPSEGLDYAEHPNISVELKNALQACIDAVEEAVTGDAKIALADRFSVLMKEVYECRKTYIEMAQLADEMMSLADNLLSAGAITGDMQDEIYEMTDDAQMAFVEGSYSLKEATQAVKAMREYGNLLPPVDEDGTYLLGNPLHFAVFAAKVAVGQVDINAKLIADVDLKDLEWQSIGDHSNSKPYKGTFDGQGYKITNLTMSDVGGSYNGLFAYVGGTVKNFSVSGNITTGEADYVGVVGEIDGGIIQNVYSTVNIEAGTGTKHTGGITGGAINSAQIIGCGYGGTLDVGTNGDSFGGLVGYAGAMTMTGCLFDGVVKGAETNEASYVGGLQGYANTTAVVLNNNISVGKVLLANASAISGTFRANIPAIYSSNYWLEGSASKAFGTNEGVSMPTIEANTFVVSAEQLASGEVCYAINKGDVTYFYQTLTQDAYPVLDATHGVVYPVGEFTCDGRAKGDIGYSNDASGIKRDEHDLEDGVCNVCHMTPDGYFGIKTGEDLKAFVDRVNAGELELNAKMVKDIDLSEVISEENPWTAAGNWTVVNGVSVAYKGHFDGMGHTIKGFNATSTHNYYGIFGVISTGALIENFTIYGTIVLKHKTGGVVGYARDATPTIRNIHSYLDIQNAANGNRPGGILGSSVNGTVEVQNCTYSGTLSTESGADDAGGNYGGIVGYVNNNTAAILNVTNCLFDGKVINTAAAPGDCTFGGFIGYSNSGIVTIKNCLSIGTVTSSVAGQYFGAVKQAKSALINCYYVGDAVNGSASTVDIPAIVTNAEQLASGEICYNLNVDNQETSSVWYQTLGEDAYPVLDKTHKIVLYDALNGYHNPNKDEEVAVEPIHVKSDSDGKVIYNLAGQRLNRLQKGINIVGGKKILY